MDVLIAYDIGTATPAGQRRLAEVAKVCESFGIRVQYSVFECRLSETMLATLTVNLLAIMHPKEDSIRIYRFPGNLADSVAQLGSGRPRALGDPWIV